ncbi:hypothetical protein [Lactovum miscens]|uniref:Uncharacterized protein n=1 Tax=Lactovum miscens TaxID=190387 RepID=A0A841C5N5_9LACT|nr:hypothetical protein [Lactovum miscens]MBB5887587.1 hypothetical protein [Lactovum miscens]
MDKILIESQVGMEVYSEFFHEYLDTDQDQEFWSNIGTGKYDLSYLINGGGTVNYEYDTLEAIYGEGFDINKLQKEFTQMLNEKRLEFGLEEIIPERKIDVNVDDLAGLLKDNPKALDAQYPNLSQIIEDAGIRIKSFEELTQRQKENTEEWHGFENIEPGELFFSYADGTPGTYSILSQALLDYCSDAGLSSGFMEYIPKLGSLKDLVENDLDGFTFENIKGYNSLIQLGLDQKEIDNIERAKQVLLSPGELETLGRGNLAQEVSSNYDLKSVGLDEKHFDALLEETAFYQDLNTQFLHEFKEWPDIFSASQYESLKEETRKQILGSQEGLQQAIYEATEANGSIEQISDYAKDILTEVNNYKVLDENLERLLQENNVFINNVAPPKIQPLNKFEERLAQAENSKSKENSKQNFSLKTGFHV